MRKTVEAAHAPSEDRYIDVEGARLRYRDEGDGPAVIFVHGWTLDLDMWEPQVTALAAAFRVIRWDRRGFGLSSGRPSLAKDVSDIRALCRHLEVQQAAFVGMSQGARVVLQLADSCPALVASLILDGPPTLDTAAAANAPPELPYEYYRSLVRTHGMAAFRRQWLEHPLAQLRTGDPHARDLLLRMIGRYPGNDLTDSPPHPALVPTPSARRPIFQPVLVINGELDTDSRKRFAAELTRQLPHAERVEIPDAGHLCSLDNPKVYGAAIKRFLDRHAASSNNPLKDT